ncbi:hypothetical protein COS70_01295, partial [Candidatus Micrarchaeota archaeon CG06_land_8_20_14_3_00_50_6]
MELTSLISIITERKMLFLFAIFVASIYLLAQPAFFNEPTYSYLLNGSGLAHAVTNGIISSIGVGLALPLIMVAGFIVSFSALSYLALVCLGPGADAKKEFVFIPAYLLATFGFFQGFLPGQFDGSAYGLALSALSFALFWKYRNSQNIIELAISSGSALAANLFLPLQFLLPFYLFVLLLERIYGSGANLAKKPQASPNALMAYLPEAIILIGAIAAYLLASPASLSFSIDLLLGQLVANKFVVVFSMISIIYLFYKGLYADEKKPLFFSGAVGLLLSAANPVYVILAIPLAIDGFKTLLAESGLIQLLFMVFTLVFGALGGALATDASWALVLAFVAVYASTVLPSIALEKPHYPALLFLVTLLALAAVFTQQAGKSALTAEHISVFEKANEISGSVAFFSYPNSYQYFAGRQPANSSQAAAWLLSASGSPPVAVYLIDLDTLDGNLSGKNVFNYIEVFRLVDLNDTRALFISSRGSVLGRPVYNGKYVLGN